MKPALSNGTAKLLLLLLSLPSIMAVDCWRSKSRPTPETGRNFYVSTNGNDAADGSLQDPFKTLARINTLRLYGGDTIFLQGGQTFNGTLKLSVDDAGSKNFPVVITSHGSGKAIINASNDSALVIFQSSNIHLINLELHGAGRKNGNKSDGLIVRESSEILIDSVKVYGFQKSGIAIYNSSRVLVNRVHALDNGATGILASGTYGARNCRDITIAHSFAENNPGDPTNLTNHSGNGILAGYCRNVRIAYCSATNNGWDMPRKGNGPVGIWAFESDSVTIENCISYRNKTSEGSADGGGFDFDGGVTNSLIQHCLSFENYGSGFGLFQYMGAEKWSNNIVRYNISINDGEVSGAVGGIYVWNSSYDSSQLSNAIVHNNTIYNENAPAITYSTEGLHQQFFFYNNILIGKDQIISGESWKNGSSSFAGNNWFSIKSGFNISGYHNLREWRKAFKQELWQGNATGLNLNPSFPVGLKVLQTDPQTLTQFSIFNIPGNSPLSNAGIDISKVVKMIDALKTFNQQPAPLRGIGAAF